MCKDGLRSGFYVIAVAVTMMAARADFSVKAGNEPVPKEISAALQPLIQDKGVQVLDSNQPLFEIWLRKEVPLKSKPSSPSSALSSIPETTLIGVVAVRSDTVKDYKDNSISKGIYTARFILQPQDGDHLGTADVNTFLILVGADADKETNSFTKFTPLVKASGKGTASGHPIVLNFRPANKSEAPAIAEPAEEAKALRLKINGLAGAEKADVLGELVFQGHGHIQ